MRVDLTVRQEIPPSFWTFSRVGGRFASQEMFDTELTDSMVLQWKFN